MFFIPPNFFAVPGCRGAAALTPRAQARNKNHPDDMRFHAGKIIAETEKLPASWRRRSFPPHPPRAKAAKSAESEDRRRRSRAEAFPRSEAESTVRPAAGAERGASADGAFAVVAWAASAGAAAAAAVRAALAGAAVAEERVVLTAAAAVAAAVLSASVGAGADFSAGRAAFGGDTARCRPVDSDDTWRPHSLPKLP